MRIAFLWFYSKKKRGDITMKKMISLALCLIIALAFAAGCKKKEEAPVAPEATQAPMTSAKAPAPAPEKK